MDQNKNAPGQQNQAQRSQGQNANRNQGQPGQGSQHNMNRDPAEDVRDQARGGGSTSPSSEGENSSDISGQSER